MKRFLRFEHFLYGLFGLLLLVFVSVLFCENCENWIRGLLDLPGKNEVLQFLGFGMGGTLFVLQVFASNKRAKAMEETATAQAQANLYTETGLRQDRLKNAIEHLGHESDSVRTGGAYELLHLAKDTEDQRQTVLDILCAHIRQTTVENQYQKAHESTPSQEVQNLLTLLFVQQHEIFADLRADLQGSYLNGANLFEARLGNALLNNAYLKKAMLGRSHLQGASFVGAHLEEAILGSVYMQGAVLMGTFLWRANLDSAHMQGTVLIGTLLWQANLEKAMLQGAILRKPQLQEAQLQGTQLQGVKTVSPKKAKSGLSFEFSNLIRESIGQESDLSGLDLGDGMSLEEIESFVKERGAITGSYTRDEAENWIAEYERTTSNTPKKSAHTGDNGASLSSFLSPS